MNVTRLIFSCVFLTASMLSNVYAEKVVKLSYVEYPPYYGDSLDDAGPYSEIIKAAFEEEGYQVVSEQLPWARAIEATRFGEYDALYTAWYREDREADFAFSSPLPPNELVFFKRKSDTVEFEDFTELKKYKIGSVRGYANPLGFEEANLDVQVVTSDKQNLQKLANSHIDLAVADRALGKYILRTKLEKYDDMIDWISPPLEIADQYLMFSRKAQDFEEKRAAFNAGLKKLQASGKVKAILDKHDF